MSKNTSAIVELWSKFSIENVKKELDEKVIEIAKQLEEGDESRKRLIEQTKEFRKSLNDEQRKMVAQILKPFQIEVDSSSKRSKLMEQVLLNLYKQLIDLPDPIPALESVQRLQKKAEKLQDLELENKALKETLEDFKAEFSQVKNQEPTIKLLRDRIKELEEKSENQIMSKLKEREKELQKTFAEKEEHFQSNQLDLVKKLGETEARLLALQDQLHKSHTDLYELKSKQEELLNAKSLEIDMLMQDIDKLNERVTNAERMSEQYAKKLAESQQQKSASESNMAAVEHQHQQQQLMGLQTSALEIELAAKEKEISQLVEDVQKLQLKSNKTREFYEKQRLQLEEKLVGRERTLEQLEYELRKKQDYDEIKKELSILKAIEFNEQYADSSSGGLYTNAVGSPSNSSVEQQQTQQKPLEVLLLEKNRFLQNENTQFKNKLHDLQTRHEKLSKENLELANVNLEQKTLIVQLEKDLLRAVQPKGGVGSESAGEIRLDLELQNNETPSQDANNNAQQGEQDTSLFNIVSSQRERFRVRVQELESENLSSKQQVLFLTNELDRLRSDNVKLYEKIKFLQSFPKSPGSHAINENMLGGTGETDEDSYHIINKYTNDYEKKLDPFSKFSYREKQKRYSNLKLHDKFTLNFGRFILSSKMARLIFFAYFLIIHLLIFGSLYFIAHKDASHRDISAECSQHYKDHMFKVHGEKSFEPPHH